MQWWQEIASERGNGPDWRRSLEKFARVPLPEPEARVLADACASPAQLDLLSDLLRDTPREPESPGSRARFFLSIVDESNASLAGWVHSLELLFRFLRSSGRDTSFGMALGFLQCCSDAAGSGSPIVDLPQITDEMLQDYGFQG